MSNELEKPSRSRWTRLWEGWKHSSVPVLLQTVLILVQTLALTYSVYLVREQTIDIENTKSNRSADFIFRFNDRLEKPPYGELRLAIASGEPILKEQGGKFTEEDLEGYLDLWEGLHDLYVKGLISKDMFYNSYSYDIEKAYDNPEVQAFVKESQKESPEFYTGFQNLAKEMKATKRQPAP
jgi:hypothetical protein